jgi:hypothetical protein
VPRPSSLAIRHAVARKSIASTVQCDLGPFQIASRVTLSQFSCQIRLGIPHIAVDCSVVVVAFVRFVIAAEIDSDEPSAINSRDDLANFASHRDFLHGSQQRHTTGALERHQSTDIQVNWTKDGGSAVSRTESELKRTHVRFASKRLSIVSCLNQAT